MKFGDTIRLEMQDANGRSIFGAIDQRVVHINSRRRGIPSVGFNSFDHGRDSNE